MLSMLGFFLWLALRQAKNTDSLFKYHLYGDDLKENRFTGSLISTNASLSGAFVLILYYGFLFGPWAFFPVWVFWLITQFTSRWTIKRTEEVMKSYDGWSNNRATIHEFLGLVFASPRARFYAGILSLISYLGLISAEIVLATHVLSYLFPNDARMPYFQIPLNAFLVIVAIMFSILIYNVLSGFRGTVQTDFAQWLIMSLMIIGVGIFVLAEWRSWTSGYATIFHTRSAGILAALFNPDRQGFAPYLSFLGSNFIFWGLWWPGAMDQWQRCAAARTTRVSLNREWGTTGIVAILYFGILTFVFLMAGVWLRVKMPNAALSDDFLRVLVIDVHQWSSSSFGHVAGLFFAIVTFLGLVCAAMSTIDSYVMTASQTFFVDIVHSEDGATIVELTTRDREKKLLMQARAFTIFIPLLVTVIALVFFLASDVYPIIYFAFSFMFALLPSLFVGLKGWAHPHARVACERSLLGGGITSILYIILIIGLERTIRKNGDTFWWYQAIYWWSAVIAIVGAFVLWANWPKSRAFQG
jgi:Na+/proline symporter